MAATETAILAAPIQAFGGRVIASPFQFTTDDDTNLQLLSVCSVSGVVLAIQGRRIDEQGRIVPLAETHAPNANRTSKTQNYKFGRGALLNLTVFAAQGAPFVGQCFVIVRLIQGLTGATIVLGTLLQGYVTSSQALGYPGSPIVSSVEGEPAVRHIKGTQPALGVEITEFCPTGARWELLSILQSFAAGPTVATRYLAFTIQVSGDGVVILSASGFGVTAGQSWFFQSAQFFTGVTPIQPVNLSFWPMPGRIIMVPGDFIRTSTGGLQADDQFGPPRFQVREWLEVP